MRGAWIEIKFSKKSRIPIPVSLPVRGAWIEIKVIRQNTKANLVAPCEGSVD